MPAKPTFKIVLESYPHVKAIKSGEIRPDKFELAFTEYKPVWDCFKPMVRELAFDISEMAIVTYILAKAHGKPLHLLPAVMLSRLQHPFASVNSKVAMDGPGDFAGKRVGIRSHTQTTITWLRGILKNDYGADLDAAHWVSFEEVHISECEDPTERAPEGRTLNDMLLQGDLDIALGAKIDDPRAKPLFADAEAEALAWYERHKVVPINHFVCVTEEMVTHHLDHIEELYALFKEAKHRLPHDGTGPDTTPLGFDAVRPSAELVLTYLGQVGLLPAPMEMADLFDSRIREAIGD